MNMKDLYTVWCYWLKTSLVAGSLLAENQGVVVETIGSDIVKAEEVGMIVLVRRTANFSQDKI